jgi:hypothetical protein
MSSTFTDLSHSSPNGTPTPPRGILPAPPEVIEYVAKEEARLAAEHGVTMLPEARRRMIQEQTLDHFYRDQWISYRETPQGMEVLAVGLEEIGRLVKEIPLAERQDVRTKMV